MASLKRAGILFCFVGPAGSGKTTIAQKLLQEMPQQLSRSISTTSRAPREKEVDGVHYHFLPREEFQNKVSLGAFFEWEETHGNYYGTLKSNLDSAVSGQCDLVLDIDIRGALNFKRAYPKHTVILFLLPPSHAALQSRIKGRGVISEEELKTRLETAQTEYSLLLSNLPEIDYLVVNDSLETAYQSVVGIVIGERLKADRIEVESIHSLLNG